MKESTTRAIAGFLLGTAVGAALGILFAPDEGAQTRQKIKNKVQDATSDAQEAFNEKMDALKDTVGEVIDDTRKKFKHHKKHASAPHEEMEEILTD